MSSLRTTQRDELLQIYREHTDPELRSRAHLIAWLAEGYTWETIEARLFCSSRTLDRCEERFEAEGSEGLTGRKRGRPFRFSLAWVAVLGPWVTTRTPRDFGLLRSRWSGAILARLLRQRQELKLSREAVRRLLHRGHLAYRRPRPTLKPDEPEGLAKLAQVRELLEGLPDDQTVVGQDGVEGHTNPRLGQMGMPKGQQAEVETPGTDRKRHLSGSIHGRTGTVFLTEAAPKPGRKAAVFIKHWDQRRPRLRRSKGIHVICDDASGPTSLEVIQYLWGWEGRIEVHLPPADSPDFKPIERVWWPWHETIPRDHRCQDLGEFLDQVFAWLGARSPFEIEGSVDPKAKAA